MIYHTPIDASYCMIQPLLSIGKVSVVGPPATLNVSVPDVKMVSGPAATHLVPHINPLTGAGGNLSTSDAAGGANGTNSPLLGV